MEMMSPAKLISLWTVEDHRLVKSSFLPDTEWMLNAIFRNGQADQISLNASDVKQLVSGLIDHHKATGHPISRKRARQRINRLLEQMNRLPNIHAVLIPEPVLAHRPTTLPNSARSFSAAAEMVELDRQLLAWCRKADSTTAWMLLLAIRLMTRLGMGEKVMLGTLSQLTLRHIDKKNKSINIPSSPNSAGHNDGHYRIRLSDDIWLPLRAIITRNKSYPADAWLFANDATSMALSVDERRKVLRQHLINMFREMLKTHKTAGNAIHGHLTSWPKMANACQYVPIFKGTPPLWSTLLRNYPLPTCTPIPLLLGQAGANHYSPGSRLGRLPDRPSRDDNDDHGKISQTPTQNELHLCRPAGLHMVPTDHLPNDWARQAKRILQNFIFEASRISNKYLHSKKHEPKMQALLEKHEIKLQQLIRLPGNYPTWVLNFIYYMLITQKNKISSAKTYLSRLTPISIFFHDAVLDMSDWDDDVIHELEIFANHGDRWSDATIESFQSVFTSFIRFCKQHDILEDVTLPKGSKNLTPSVLRTRILSPDHMDTAWEELTKHTATGSTSHMKALVISLGFYGGLRASEIEALTLNDIQFSFNNPQEHRKCWIDILGGKTDAARRRVPLHILAPPSVVLKLRAWVTARREACQEVALADIALFGPRHSPDAYKRRHLITLAIEEMRHRLGEDIDFHGLRHAAVSWTLLRLHAAQHPGFADTLQHRHHWMFQPDTLKVTLDYFCGAEGTDTLARGTVLLHLAKWIGHRDPATLLENYAHTLGLIHGDILAPARNK